MTAWTPVGLARDHTAGGLTTGELYTFEVRAVNGEGAGPAARTQSRAAGRPSVPQALDAAAEDGRVVLQWSAPADSGNSDIETYWVRHAEGASMPQDTVWSRVGLETEHTVSRLANGALHTFEVQAVNRQGAGPAAQIQATPEATTDPEPPIEPTPVTVPSAPEGLSATAADGTVTLSWSAPADTGDSNLVTYQVRYAEGASVPQDRSWFLVGLATGYTATGLANGVQHSFEVRAVNGEGAGPAAQVQATPEATTEPEPPIEPAPATVPSAPQAVYVVWSLNYGNVRMSWQTPADTGGSEVVRYEVRHAEGASVPADAAWTPVGLETEHTAAGLTAGGLYTFEVRAVNGEGAGPAAQIQSRVVGRPSVPQALDAAAEDGRVVLQWSTPADTGDSNLVTYQVRHAEGASVPQDKSWLSVGLATEHTVTGLANGVQHSFEVRAVNGKGAGPAAQVQATPEATTEPEPPIEPTPATVPSAPEGLSATAADGTVTLSWSAPADTGGSEVVRYELRHAEGASVPADAAWTPVGLATEHTATGLANGAQHSFEVRAANGEGAGPAAQVQATPEATTEPEPPVEPTPATVPSAPEGLSATAADGTVTLSWSAPADTGGSEVVRYELRHAEGASVPAKTAWTPVGLETEHTATGLANGAQHSFEVRAVNGEGAGPAAQVQATPEATTEPEPPIEPTPATVPSAPEGLSATAADGTVTLSWSAPADTGSSEVVRYELRHAEGASVPADAAWTPVGLETEHTATGLANGAQHSFEVRAVNGEGAGPAAQVQAMPATAPSAPEGLSATAVDARVVLSWSAPADTGGSKMVRYEMRLAEGASVPAATAWTSVGMATEHTATGLANGAQHSFEVRAVNGEGAGPAAQVQAMPRANGAAKVFAPAKEWNARFGRTVADQILGAIENRMSAAPKPGVEAHLAGHAVGGAAAGDKAGPDRRKAASQAVALGDLLNGSAFALTAETADEGLLSVWGQGAFADFSGRADGVSFDGEVSSGMLGADWTRGRSTAGLLLSHSEGEGGYLGSASGEVSSSLTGLFPWVRYKPTDKSSVWGVAGHGQGSLTVTPAESSAIRTDLELWMAAGGLRGVLLDGGRDGPTLAAKADAMFVQTASDAIAGRSGRLEAARADVLRLRLGLEGSQVFGLANGATLTPNVEIGLRHDGGDAETGFGADLGGGLAWADPETGLSTEIRGRGLLSHEAQGFREFGFAGSLTWDPREQSDRGPRLTLTQSLGAAARGGADALLGSPTPVAAVAGRDDAGLHRRRMEARFAYGFSAFGDRFTSTPEVSVGLSDAGRDYRLGWTLSRASGDSGSLDFSVEALRRESAGAPAEHVVRFGLTARF